MLALYYIKEIVMKKFLKVGVLFSIAVLIFMLAVGSAAAAEVEVEDALR